MSTRVPPPGEKRPSLAFRTGPTSPIAFVRDLLGDGPRRLVDLVKGPSQPLCPLHLSLESKKGTRVVEATEGSSAEVGRPLNPKSTAIRFRCATGVQRLGSSTSQKSTLDCAKNPIHEWPARLCSLIRLRRGGHVILGVCL